MNGDIRRQLIEYLNYLKLRHNNETLRLNALSDYTSKRLKVTSDKNGNKYYSLFSDGERKPHYLGTDKNETVNKIKEAKYLHLSCCEVEREINLLKKYLNRSRSINYEDINLRLKKAYQGSSISDSLTVATSGNDWVKTSMEAKESFQSFRPEDLIHKTRDGNMVRSKGEAIIYNYLLELGLTFIYELPITNNSVYRNVLMVPDFTILVNPESSRVVYLEHQGMMNDPSYRNKFNDMLYKYWSNNITPGIDVFFTFDLPNGGFDDEAVRAIVTNIANQCSRQ